MSSFIGLEHLQQEPAVTDRKRESRKKKSDFGGLNELFGMEEGQGDIVEISLSDIVAYRNHKFKPCSPAKLDMLRDSIKEFGIISPCIVRPAESIAYKIDRPYETLAGHTRIMLAAEIGLSAVPCIIKKDLSEDEAEQIVVETNLQRSLEEMTHSERAAVLSSHYDAQKRRQVRTEVLDEINSYLQTYANPVNSMAEAGLSPMATKGLRGLAEEHDLSKDTIARYIRVDTLIDEVKLLLDDEEIALRTAVELSYISKENQEVFVSLINNSEYKCDISKAKLIRELQSRNKLTIATMTEVLSGKLNKKKPGKPKGYKVSGRVIQKYFKEETDEKKIGEIIEEAIKRYFEEN